MTFLWRKSFASVLATALCLIGAVAHAEPNGKWRIKFNHSASSEGVIVFRIEPIGGTPIDVSTKIPDRTGENSAADKVRDSFKLALGKNYGVEVDDWESVIVKKKGKTPKFELTLVSSTVAGLSIDLKHE